MTRNSDYGERYKLFLIKENSFEKKYTLQDFGLNVVTDKNKLVIVDTIKWNGLAKKAGFQQGDIISEFKIENTNRPDKDWVYPLALILLGLFGFFNYKRDKN